MFGPETVHFLKELAFSTDGVVCLFLVQINHRLNVHPIGPVSEKYASMGLTCLPWSAECCIGFANRIPFMPTSPVASFTFGTGAACTSYCSAACTGPSTDKPGLSN